MIETLPHPTRRNVVWITLQYLLRVTMIFSFRLRVRGRNHIPKQGGGLVLTNHQSFLDPLILGTLGRPFSFLARDTLFPIPVIGWVLRNTYVIPINRAAASTTSIRLALQRMKHGFTVGMFPEGTRSADGDVKEFKPGFVSFIRRSKLPVYPVGIAGAHLAMPRSQGVKFRPVRVVIGAPLDPEKLRGLSKAEIVDFARDAVVACQAEAEAWRNRL
jgi:1-acyl-sn-glycerol-3-phosphate acyltransferase